MTRPQSTDDSPSEQGLPPNSPEVGESISIRTRGLGANAELREKIAEQQRVEDALRETERELQEAIERHQQLNIELDQRVRERTRELADREQRLRELSSELQRVEQRERQRLATLLHDHVQQMLVAAKLRVDLVAGQSVEPARSRLIGVVERMGDAINATRDLSVQLAPPLLHDQGLAVALDWLTARLGNMHGLVVQQDLDPAADPRNETGRDILFHTAHELLLNVVKHSQSNQVELSLSRGNGCYRLEIADQGVGFEADSSTQQGSFGLFQLRQWLENAAGTLVVDSHPGQGTRVIATLPVSGGQRESS